MHIHRVHMYVRAFFSTCINGRAILRKYFCVGAKDRHKNDDDDDTLDINTVFERGTHHSAVQSFAALINDIHTYGGGGNGHKSVQIVTFHSKTLVRIVKLLVELLPSYMPPRSTSYKSSSFLKNVDQKILTFFRSNRYFWKNIEWVSEEDRKKKVSVHWNKNTTAPNEHVLNCAKNVKHLMVRMPRSVTVSSLTAIKSP